MNAQDCGRGWPHRIARRIPAVILEQPWALFVMGLCVISGMTTFLGPAPGSIETTLPRFVVYLWSGTLVAGASAGLVGLLRPNLRRVELAGLVWLGTAAIVYGATIMLRFGLGGIVPGSIVLGFGAAALVRALAVYVAYEVARRVTHPEAE
jgi:hypothetical protein